MTIPLLDDLRKLVYDEGWVPGEGEGGIPASYDTVTVEKDGARREVAFHHIVFHRFVEGVKEDFRL